LPSPLFLFISGNAVFTNLFCFLFSLSYGCKAGHGAGKPTTKAIEETADGYAFVANHFKLNWKD
jgi:hypothetical protein